MKKYEKLIRETALILFGNLLYAFAVVYFILPNGLVTGGTTGLALSMNHYFGIPVSGFVMVSNTVMFVLGAALLGKKFALTTVLSTFSYPVMMAFLEQVLPSQPLDADPVLSAVYAGALIGIAMGIVIREGASTGGLDIPPLALNKYFGFPVGMTMNLIDGAILIAQMTFRSREQILYGILLIFLYTTIIDKILMSGSQRIELKIVSTHQKELQEIIMKEIDRGVTLVHSKTGFLGRECDMILTVISPRELPRLRKRVQEVDPEAFLIVSEAREVRGRGFSMEKIYEGWNQE